MDNMSDMRSPVLMPRVNMAQSRKLLAFKGRLDLFYFRLRPQRLNRLHLITSIEKSRPCKRRL